MKSPSFAAPTTIHAPAKVNLFFEILGKRPDGFHEIETLMVPLRWYDTLTLLPTEAPEIQLDYRWSPGLLARFAEASSSGTPAELGLSELPTDRKNIVVRALELLQQRSQTSFGAQIHLLKRLPAEAGLGGGSSDGAMALLLANQAWGLNWSLEQLAQLAAEIGSDVPFFLYQCAAVCRGRGEQLTVASGIAPLHLVVVRPPVGLSTPAVYRQSQVPASPRSVEPLLAALRTGDQQQIRQHLWNRLEQPARSLTPWIERLERAFQATGCYAQQMSGSGSSYFGLYAHATLARRAAARLQAQQLGYVTATAA